MDPIGTQSYIPSPMPMQIRIREGNYTPENLVLEISRYIDQIS